MIEIARLNGAEPGFEQRLGALLARVSEGDAATDAEVAAILRAVRERGDAALLEYTRRFDGAVDASALEVPPDRIAAAARLLDAGVLAALGSAAQRIRAFHERQVQESWTFDDGAGSELGQRTTPLDRVGVYVPGGKAAYPSTVLMNVIPARIAGVGQIIMVVPAPDGELNPAVLAAASIAGVDRVFRVGGAQAIAALAFGTESISAVDKIVGPGNRWVAAAKRQVFGIVGIDMIAGPSEVVVISDGSTDPEWVAADLLAQAEHDEDARAILIGTRAAYLDEVQAAMERLLPRMPRAPIIRSALARNGAFILVGDLALAAAIANRFAPEHLGLSVAEPEALLGSIRHAGAIFVGCFASEVLGDYCAGPNHVLPTGRAARFASPLGVQDFQKRSSIVRCSREGAAHLARTASVLAAAEGLTAHAEAAALRMKGRRG
ncbi:MAG TPA: histidinol dehydrogenase [Gammaproteobacteria bacterium]